MFHLFGSHDDGAMVCPWTYDRPTFFRKEIEAPRENSSSTVQKIRNVSVFQYLDRPSDPKDFRAERSSVTLSSAAAKRTNVWKQRRCSHFSKSITWKDISSRSNLISMKCACEVVKGCYIQSCILNLVVSCQSWPRVFASLEQIVNSGSWRQLLNFNMSVLKDSWHVFKTLKPNTTVLIWSALWRLELGKDSLAFPMVNYARME